MSTDNPTGNFPPYNQGPQNRPGSNTPMAPVVSVPLNQPLRVEIARRGFFAKAFSAFGWVAAGFMFLALIGVTASYKSYINPNPQLTEHLNESGTKNSEKQARAKDKIAIITVDGTIMDYDGFTKWQVDHVREDDDVKAIVLRVDSPGGSVTASNVIWHKLKDLAAGKKVPLVVSMGGLAASGGYYISMAATPPEEKVIFAEETTITGSIGVMMPHYDISGLLKKWDIKDDAVVSHPLKNAGSMTKEFKPEERKIFQQLIDEAFDEFKAKILAGRPNMKKEALDKLATGQIYTAKQAKENGLVDEIGYLDDAIAQAAKLAGLKIDEVRPVRFKKPKGLFEGISAEAKGGTNLESQLIKRLMNATTPRPYYLFSSLPLLEGIQE